MQTARRVRGRRGGLAVRVGNRGKASIQAAHTRLTAALVATKPHRISVYRIADRDDLEERAKHFTKVLGAVKAYAVALVDDTADSASLDVLNKGRSHENPVA